jgi:hypothetical protein
LRYLRFSSIVKSHRKWKDKKKIEKVYPYLLRTEPYSLFAFGSFKVSAYLLLRQEGNLFIYSSKKIEQYFPFIEEKGGLAPQAPRYTTYERLLNAKVLSDVF